MQTNSAVEHAHGDHEHHDHEHHDPSEMKQFGLWIYLMSDCIVFGTLFATYAVLVGGTAGGPGPQDLFDLPLIFLGTMFLLLSSITFGFAVIAMKRNDEVNLKIWLLVTGVLGAGFLGVEIYEFYHLIAHGNGPDRSAFLSSFFALVGTHGLHVFFGIVWLTICCIQLNKHGITELLKGRLLCLSLFWHFLDIVWICVFSMVYLMGVI